MAAVRCKFPGCGNKASAGVRLFQLPHDPEKLRLLREHLNLDAGSSNWRPCKYDRICSDHFPDSGGTPYWLRANNSKDCDTDNESDGDAVNDQEATQGETMPTTIYRVDAHTSSLCQSLYKLTLADHQFCDVTLKLNLVKKEYKISTVDHQICDVAVELYLVEKDYKAHSPVLATCSTFFKSILDKPEHRHVKNVVILLPDFIQPEGLEPILLFVYTGDLGVNSANITAIYQVAVLFELSAAIALCNKFVETNHLSQTLLSIEHAGRAEIVPSECKDRTDEVEDQSASGCKVEPSVTEVTEQMEGENGENKVVRDEEYDYDDFDEDDDEDDDDDIDISDDDEEMAEVSEKCCETQTIRVVNEAGEALVATTMEVSIMEETDDGARQDKCPIRRSLRKQGQKIRVGANSESPTKKNHTKPKAKAKGKIAKVKQREMRSPKKKLKVEDDPGEVASENILSKIDPTLKYTDPAKYIAELINKNSDMLNEHGGNTQGGGVQVITRGKVTYIFPDGVEASLPAAADPLAEATPVTIPVDAKVNSEGLPYEKIVDPRTCSECNLSFPSVNIRDEHVEAKHPGQNSGLKQVVFQCLTCSFSTDFLRNMWFHCHWKHAFPLPNTLRQYCCGLCDYRAPAQGNIEVHIRRVHTQERPLMCDVCGQFFKSLDTLRGHRFYRHQDIYPFQCNVCEKQFKRRHKLEVHMRIHLGLKPFSCTECQYATYTKFNLKDHMRKRHLKELDSVTKLAEQVILS